MGSTGANLPSADSPTLTLALPTPEECRRVWTGHHQTWGGALSLEAYVKREAYLLTVPLAMNNGATHWILTDASQPPNERPIYSSCETLRKHGMAATLPEGAPEPVVVDGIAHGIASVYTDPVFRGKGYAGRMLTDLGKKLKTWQVASSALVDSAETSPAKTLFSVLYSDIGKQYYARKGWAAFPSTHLTFQTAAAETAATESPAVAKDSFEVTPLGYHELTELCPIDVGLLRDRLSRRAARQAKDTSKTHGPSVALVPDLNTMLWHLMREDYMTKHIFGKTPIVRGALCSLKTASGKQRSIWAIWTRGYYAGLKTIEGNTLYILHIVLEDLDDDFPLDPDEVPVSQDHVDGFAAILRMAQAEAAAWHCGSVQMWNPTPAQRLLADRTGIPYQEVDREKDSIASLMWNRGSEDGVVTETVDWVDNEKYGWY
ncbi:lysine acetyltransferase [Ophiostoma piceae UAMH 11346]|uniref:Lysine acetyltransferase n=1 Tax=Ophiostoma piceae (strain UAMH 11346) TaxID=1262450 RepID=S3CIV3_OPHP1|nr:lysine acetyltransferase [Ophiostoma piceae UAMH 11346]